MKRFILALVLVAWVTSASAGSVQQTGQAIWMSPNGRYAALFPGIPDRIDIDSPIGVGYAYQLLEEGPRGAIIYQVSVLRASVLDGITSVSDADARKILSETANLFAQTIGLVPAEQKLTWGTFAGGLPLLRYEYRLRIEGTELLGLGFWVLDGVQAVKVGGIHRVDLDSAKAAEVKDFLDTFMIVSKESSQVPLNIYVIGVAESVSLDAFECPAELEHSLATGVRDNGGTHLGMYCFLGASRPETIRANIDEARRNSGVSGVGKGWKPNSIGGVRLVESVRGEGVAWWVYSSEILTPQERLPGVETVVYVQMMR